MNIRLPTRLAGKIPILTSAILMLVLPTSQKFVVIYIILSLVIFKLNFIDLGISHTTTLSFNVFCKKKCLTTFFFKERLTTVISSGSNKKTSNKKIRRKKKRND